MKISIIGKGNVGSVLKAALERVGHEVHAVGRDPAEIKDAGAFGELLILAVPYAGIDAALTHLGDTADGKVVIDATNVLTPELELAVGFDTSGAEIVQSRLPSAKVIKAFNSAFAGTMAEGSVKGERLAGLVAGDDPAAKQTVLDLVASLGFDSIDAGPLKTARLLEPYALMAIRLGLVQGYGTEMGFKLVR